MLLLQYIDEKGDIVIKGNCNCVVCNNKNEYCINTNVKGYNSNDYALFSKNEDGSFNAEILVNCNYCGAVYKIKKRIIFVPDIILKEPYNETEVYK